MRNNINFRNFFDAEAKKAGHEDIFNWDEWSFIIKQVCYTKRLVTQYTACNHNIHNIITLK